MTPRPTTVKIPEPIDLTDETIDDRRQNIVDWFVSVAKYPTDEEDQHEKTRRYVKAGALPLAWLRRHKHGYDTYKRVCAVGEWKATLLADEDAIRERLEERRDSKMPGNLPQDGSKGQWQAAKGNDISALLWLLNGNTEGTYNSSGELFESHRWDGLRRPSRTAFVNDTIYHEGHWVSVSSTGLVAQVGWCHMDEDDEEVLLYLRVPTDDEYDESAFPSHTVDELEPLAEWQRDILNRSRGKPFQAPEEVDVDNLRDEDIVFHERPFLKGDIVHWEDEDEGPLFGQIVSSKNRRRSEPRYRLATRVMTDPPTLGEAVEVARTYDVYESDLTHADEMEDRTALKEEYR